MQGEKREQEQQAQLWRCEPQEKEVTTHLRSACCHCEKRSDEAISVSQLSTNEIASLHSHNTGREAPLPRVNERLQNERVWSRSVS